MPLTDISLLFKDIIETPQQKQQRLFAEGQAAAGQFTGLPTGLRELAMGTASGIPNMVESVRQFGATAGLPVQTQGEQMQGAMANFNIDDPNSRIAVLNQLRAIDPMRAVTFGEILKDRDAQQATAAEAATLRRLQMANELADDQARRDAEAYERTQAIRAQEEIESGKESMIRFVNSSGLEPREKVRINELIIGNQFNEDGLEQLIPMVSPEEDWRIMGNNAYNFDTHQWLTPPTDETGSIKLSSVNYDAASILRFEAREAEIRADDTLSEEQKTAAILEAGQNIIKERIPGEKWEEVERTDEDGNEYTAWVSIPSSRKGINEARGDLRALNARNRLLADQAQNGLLAIGRIREDIAKADETGDELVGGFQNIIASYIPGTNEFALGVDIGTLNAVMGITGLQENREGSASGASGFGQLSDREMTVLQQRVAAVLQSSNREEFLENLQVVEDYLSRQKNRGSVRMNYDQYIGLLPEPEVPDVASRTDL